MPLTVVILTLNEEIHIRRAVLSVREIASRIVVVDSGSQDRTVEIACELGADVHIHPFVTQAQQFNWALSQLPAYTDWVFRLDADEIVSSALANEIAATLPTLGAEVDGVEVPRRMAFMGRPIRWGGVFPVFVVRLFRYGAGRSEDRWMDEHIVVSGAVARLRHELIDESLKCITWWTDKHNSYSSREVLEILRKEELLVSKVDVEKFYGRKAGVKLYLRDEVYRRTPSGIRALLYFLYRYVVRAGFLDGREGATFHILQAFWYRYLVDVKLYEVKKYMRENNADVVVAINDVLGIAVKKFPSIGEKNMHKKSG